MAASSSSTPTFSAAQHSMPKFRNWLALGHALTTVLCQGLRPFINREMENFYRNVTARLAAAGPCTCVYVPKRRPNQYHDMSKCAWANVLQAHHHANRPNWKQSDSTKWLDPHLGPWEIAKLFLPDLGGHAGINSAEDMDITGILNLMYWCNHFSIPQPLIKDVRDTRNNKWVHVPKLELSDAEKTTAFGAIENLLKDPHLAHDPDAQNALREIQTLKCVSDLNNFQAQVLTQYKEMIEKDMSNLKSEITSLKKESRRNQKLRNQLEGRLRNMQNSLEKVNKIRAGNSYARLVKNGALFVCRYLIKCTRAIKRLLTPWLMFLLLCSCFTILDPRSYKDGCPAEDASVPFETKDINMTEYLNTARAENFIGRQWLYREIEDLLIGGDISGVLIIGNPGTGKSALSSQLICSRTSSPKIHTHILGYHLCKYSDKNTQMAGKFVRNLAEMVARRLPEYGFLVSNSSYIQRSFEVDCIQNQDPVGCFEQTIISPLRNLKNEPRENWYIVLDALDECLTQAETSHSIVYLLNNKIPRFPPWLKVIMTSRNESDASIRSSKIKKLIINPSDPRNLEDIELFVTTRLYQGGPLLYRITSWFGDDSVGSTTKLINELLSKSQGNFLFVKEVLHHWELSKHDLRDAYALPRTLGDLYHSYFERLYPDTRKGSFTPARRVLELLVAGFEPLTQKEIFEVLKVKETGLDEEYDFKNRLQQLDHFLKYGENGTITLYHLSLIEWLISEGNGKFFVSKKKGHEIFCDYYFRLIRGGGKSTLLKYILTLAQHIAYGGWKEGYVQEFLNFPSQTVNSSDPQSNRTLLHLAATVNSTDVLELLLRHFSCIDCADNRGITPAFLAAQHGLVDNLALLIKKGAKVNRKTKSFISMHKAKIRAALQHIETDDFYHDMKMSVFQSKSKFFGSSLLHVAAQSGQINVVRFLLANNAFISTVSGAHLTAIQLAAENGHLEVVKLLHEAGAVADQTALHHTAANNRLEVVKFLLDIGVKDLCLRCDGSFYWLKNKRRFQSSLVKLALPLKQACSLMHRQASLNQNHSFLEMCVDWEKTSEDLAFGELFDDKHLIFCQTALHAAVASGHDKVASRLLSEELNALNCYDYTGRTAIHEAVRKNNTKMVDILLEKRPQMVHYKCTYWQQVDASVSPEGFLISERLSYEELDEYFTDICHCGYTPLHLAARYGHEHLGIRLIIKGANVHERDCSGATPFHVAACHNQVGFIAIFSLAKVGGDINSKTFNGSTPLHSAAACGAVEVIDYMVYHKANLTAVDDYGLTALHYSILNVNSSQLDQKVLLNDSCSNESLKLVTIDRSGHLSTFFEEKHHIKSTDRLHWLDTLLKLVLRGSDVDAVDINGRTALHIAANNGLADAVNVLLQRNATMEKRDKNKKTALELAVENATIVPKHPPFVLTSKIDYLHQALRDHEMVVYLLLSYGATFRKCKRSEGSLLHRAILNRQPYTVQLLLLKGASLTCKDNLGRTPLVTYLHNGGEWIDVVLKHFNVSVAFKCGKPFNTSVLHLLSYRPPTLADNNFFETTTCNECGDPVECKTKRGPLAEAIESHPSKQGIINSCLDAEGFTPLHRAAQGANEIAIRYLLSNGANDSILSPHGHDSLTLAVLHAGSNLWQFYGVNISGEHLLGITQASDAAIELLHHAMKSHGYQIACDSSKPELNLYHFAASRGLVKFIDVLFKERESHQLDVDCPNVDGVTPMYLAKIFGNNVKGGLYNPWDHVVQIIKRHGGEMRYPGKDAEYNLIYNLLNGLSPSKLTLDLSPDILHFISSLVKMYEDSKNSSFHCRLDEMEVNLASNYSKESSSSTLIMQEMLRHMDVLYHNQLKIMEEKQHLTKKEHLLRELFLEQAEQCLLEGIQFSRYLSKLVAHGKTYAKRIAKTTDWETLTKVQLNWFQEEVLILMEMQHTEIFRSFHCTQSLFDQFESLLKDKKAKVLIWQYENSIPLFYLNYICFNFQFILASPLSRRVRDDITSFGSYLRHSYFVSERIKISPGSDPTHLQSLSLEWPLEFLIKRFFGFSRRYDYLRTLHVGLERSTHVNLYPEKMRQLLDSIKKNMTQMEIW